MFTTFLVLSPDKKHFQKYDGISQNILVFKQKRFLSLLAFLFYKILSMTHSTMADISGLHPYYFVAFFKKIKCKFLFHFFSYFWLFRIRKEKKLQRTNTGEEMQM
jgi:hypothetical protein